MRYSLFVLLLFVGIPVQGGVISTLTYGPPTIEGAIVRYPLTLNYTGDGSEQLVFFSLDVSASAPSLTADGTDYSAFSFTPASPLLDMWSPIEGAEFGPGALKSVVQYDTESESLPPGEFELGELAVDFQGQTLPADAVSLDAPDTVIGIEVPGTVGTFRFEGVEPFFIVPEPSSTLILSVMLIVVATRYPRRLGTFPDVA